MHPARHPGGDQRRAHGESKVHAAAAGGQRAGPGCGGRGDQVDDGQQHGAGSGRGGAGHARPPPLPAQ
ncbi:hypothetical protein G6F40_015394 [Rhizopus arrhizus]|nr:hypothetical protein G6F40_015394 [Rhizopus arrhizus]